jgi:hypothetical protein
MNSSLITLELCVIALGIVLMLADFFVLPERKKFLAYGAIVVLAGLLLISLSGDGICSVFGTAFNGSYIEDPLALFFKRFFLVAAILVLFLASEFADRISAGISEYYSLVIFALGRDAVCRLGQRLCHAVRFRRTDYHHVLRAGQLSEKPDGFAGSGQLNISFWARYPRRSWSSASP